MRFRKKPVVIEAVQWTGENTDEMWAFAGANVSCGLPEILVHTLEGTMCGLPGDWIIKGVKGEFYPCKPDIFAATYEAVE